MGQALRARLAAGAAAMLAMSAMGALALAAPVAADPVTPLAESVTTTTAKVTSVIGVGDDLGVTAEVKADDGPVNAGLFSYVLDGGAPIPVGPPDGNGAIGFNIEGLQRGSHTVQVTYTGANGWADSASPTITMQVWEGTTITLDAPASAEVGEDVEVTATVAAGSGPVTAGTVSYAIDGGTPIGAGGPSGNGEVTFTLTGLAVGDHTITASYAGANHWDNSTASPIDITIQPTALAPTTLEIGIDPAAPRAHEPVEISATLTSNGDAVTEGTVRFTIAGEATEIAAADLATTPVTVTPTSADEVAVLVEYLGSDTFASSSASTSFTPSAMPTSSVLSAPAEAIDGDTVTLTAEVTADNASVSAAGSVTFSNGSEELGSVPLASGTASLEVQLPAGAHTLTATFEPGAGFAGSDATADLAVSPVVAAGGPYAIAEGESVTLSAAGSSDGGAIGWDLDGDDDFSDASGAEVVLTWAELEAFGIDDGPVTYPIEVSAAVDGLTALATGEIKVTNTGPDVIVEGPRSAVVGEPLTLKVSADDPSSADMAELFTYRVDWGDGSPVVEVVGPADPPVTHTYTQAGDVQATFSVVDRDGDGGGSMTLALTVAPAAVDPTPDPSDDPTTGNDPTPSEDPSTSDPAPSADPTQAAPTGPTLPESGVPDGVSLALGAAAALLVAGAALALLRRRLTH